MDRDIRLIQLAIQFLLMAKGMSEVHAEAESMRLVSLDASVLPKSGEEYGLGQF